MTHNTDPRDVERQAFEAWFQKAYHRPVADAKGDLNDLGRWIAWKARAALSEQAQPEHAGCAACVTCGQPWPGQDAQRVESCGACGEGRMLWMKYCTHCGIQINDFSTPPAPPQVETGLDTLINDMQYAAYIWGVAVGENRSDADNDGDIATKAREALEAALASPVAQAQEPRPFAEVVQRNQGRYFTCLAAPGVDQPALGTKVFMRPVAAAPAPVAPLMANCPKCGAWREAETLGPNCMQDGCPSTCAVAYGITAEDRNHHG